MEEYNTVSCADTFYFTLLGCALFGFRVSLYALQKKKIQNLEEIVRKE